MKIKIKKFSEVFIFVFAIVLISVIIDVSIISLAQEEEEAGTVTATSFDCMSPINEYLLVANAEFDEFLIATATGEKPSDVVTELVTDKYNEYVSALEDVYNTSTQYAETQVFTDVSSKISICRQEVDDNIEANEKALSAIVVSSSYAKKTTALLDEYKWINDRLYDMQETVSFINSYITKMADLMPAFTKTCVKS